MIRRSLTMLFLSLIFMQAMAQAGSVRPVEFELHYGIAYQWNNMHGANRSGGPSGGVELRYNFRSPIDVALLIDLTTVYYEKKQESSDKLEQGNLTTMIGFAADYNIKQGKAINPFFGCCVGFALHDLCLDTINATNDGQNTLAIRPRIGVEMWRHLRLSLSSTLSCKYYDNMCISVGLVLGGEKK